MLRLLLYSNEINVAGLIYSSSMVHHKGDTALGIDPYRWPAPGARLHIDEAVDAYAQVYANLVQHDARYPTPDHLRSLIREGNVIEVGDMRADTEGSDLIKEILVDDEPGQVFLQAWGGPNTIARALRSVEDEFKGTGQWESIYAKIVDKAVITSFGLQDTTFTDYIKPHWPDIQSREVATSTWGYGACNVVLPADTHYLTADWTRDNVTRVGPIGAAYRVWGDGKQMAAGFDDEDYFGLSGYNSEQLTAMGYKVWTPPQPKNSWISEGDSSNFALLIDNGLRNWQDPRWGGWGGRQIVDPADPKRWLNKGALDATPQGTTANDYSSARFFSAIQNDFAARLKWSVTSDPTGANHHPKASVAEGLDLIRHPGETVTLHGKASHPDGNAVTLRWWQYQEAGTFPSTVRLSAIDDNSTALQIPRDAEPGQTIHVILEAMDNGSPALTHYQRVVITVADPRLQP
ncbi:uncharacterized protein DUF1593 [Kribbella sp. VKM Ac-2527]|uniref:Uncharacterized protein DUF1593 n=2 Tax=Kribbella caucasensis TaxID=2512215 RepID=A0A4R6KGK7_9ACTN|nr:uncharacterized protein DUF1593 [Kribbella sp. VKM Ac-2527]